MHHPSTPHLPIIFGTVGGNYGSVCQAGIACFDWGPIGDQFFIGSHLFRFGHGFPPSEKSSTFQPSSGGQDPPCKTTLRGLSAGLKKKRSRWIAKCVSYAIDYFYRPMTISFSIFLDTQIPTSGFFLMRPQKCTHETDGCSTIGRRRGHSGGLLSKGSRSLPATKVSTLPLVG